jgi:hypothetical protein
MHEADSESKIFDSSGFGRSIYHTACIDKDFTYSVVSVYLQEKVYNLEDKAVAYFCFPCLGVAVPLKPEDVLIFNPLKPHAIHQDVMFQMKFFAFHLI